MKCDADFLEIEDLPENVRKTQDRMSLNTIDSVRWYFERKECGVW